MFNRDPFNRTPFNRSFSVDILASIGWTGEGGMSIKGIGQYLAKISMDGEGDFDITAIRDKFTSIDWSGIGELTISAIRDKFASIGWAGEGEFTIGAERYRIETIEITGSFAPGDKFVLDSKKIQVKKNGVVVGYDGDLFNLNPGENVITFSADELVFSVLMRVTHRDKDL